MKTLILMRHAKSSWKDHHIQDVERPLKKRGKKDAEAMGKFLTEKELLPQKIYCSPAKRAKRTAEILVEESHTEIPIEYLEQLYMAEVPALVSLLSNIPDDLERIMIVGHNPGLEGLAQMLSGQIESLPTCAVAHISIPVKEWKEITNETPCDLVDLFKPKHEKDK